MSLHDSSTSKQILRTFSLQENANIYKNKLAKSNRTPKIDSEFTMSEELQKIKDEYETLERKNQEELEIIQQQFGNSACLELQDLQEFLGKSPGLTCSRETTRNVQKLINNEFKGYIEPKRDNDTTKLDNRKLDNRKLDNRKLDTRNSDNRKLDTRNLDDILNTKNEEISTMKEKFLTFTENYKIEAEKLAEQEKRTKSERDELKKKLEEAQKKFDLQNCFVKELEHNNQDLHIKLGQINKEIEREIKNLQLEAETEKKRYLGNLKKLIELFQLEKIRIEDTLTSLSSDINIEKNQHFQDVEQLKEIIDQLKDEVDKCQQEKAVLYAESRTFPKNLKFQSSSEEKQYKVFQEIEDHRKYTHELEMIIKNLGLDNQTLETENIELKKRYEEKLEQIKDDAEDNRRQLHEELEMFKHKFNSLQEIKAENEYILAENEALKSNLNNIDEKYVRRIRVMNADTTEKHRFMSSQIEKQNLTIERLNNEQTDLKIFIKNLEITLKDKTNEITKLEHGKNCLEKKKLEIQATLDKTRKQVEHKIREHDEHLTQMKAMQEAEVKKLKADICRLQKESKDFQTGMIEQETLYKILKVDFDEYVLERDEQLMKFNKEKETINEGYQKKIEELNSQIAELQTINLNYEEIEQDLHKQIQTLVHNMNQLNYDNQQEVDRLRQEIKKQIGQELEELQKFKHELEEQIILNEKENARLKSELQFKTQRCNTLEEELKGLKNSHQDLSLLLEESRERYEDEIEQLKLSNDRILKRNKDEISKLLKEFEQQSLFCDHLDKRKKELERINKNYTDNLEHVTKVYERELEDLRLDLQNTKACYENKLSHSKTEAIFETKKYENRITELEQELKMVKYEVEWLREVRKE